LQLFLKAYAKIT